MAFLKFLEKKPKQPSFRSNNNNNSERDNYFTKSTNLSSSSLPPLPILHPDENMVIPSELEDPFGNNNNHKSDFESFKVPTTEKEFEELPPLPTLGKKGGEKIKPKKESTQNLKSHLHSHPKSSTKSINTHEEKFEFPDMSDAPEVEEVTLPEEDKTLRKTPIEGPLFLNISGFKDIVSDINSIKKDLREGSKILETVLEMKDRQDHRFIKFNEDLQDMESKFMFVDKTLFETKHY